MPIFTRSAYQKQEQEENERIVAMAKENHQGQYNNTNPLTNLQEKEITTEEIEKVQQDPHFHKFMEKMLEQDMEKYLLLLADKGAKLPKDFDVNQLKETATPNSTSIENPNQIDALTKSNNYNCSSKISNKGQQKDIPYRTFALIHLIQALT